MNPEMKTKVYGFLITFVVVVGAIFAVRKYDENQAKKMIGNDEK